MRISTRRLKRRRLNLIKTKKGGATFSELQRRFGVSPNYLVKLFKGKDIDKYCEHCGENDPEVLEKHHPDKENRPDYAIWLCSNCHSKITRKEAKERTTQKTEEQNISKQSPVPQKMDDLASLVELLKSGEIELTKAQKKTLGRISLWAFGGTTAVSLGLILREALRTRQSQEMEEQRKTPQKPVQPQISPGNQAPKKDLFQDFFSRFYPN